jgi:DNA-binding NtrC family response regulator
VNRILLIEDDSGAQLLYRNRLADLGFEVVVAATGAMGLMEARAGKFDLYLVDIGLGSGIDGYEVCRRLKAIPEIHNIPVVLISGQVRGQEELHRGYEAGCQSFLVKGDLTLLEDVVRAMLRIKSLQDDLALQNRLLEEQNRRLQAERERGADLEDALRETGSRQVVFRELAAGRPDGVLIVDGEGVVRRCDRAARDTLGQGLEGKHLASMAPDSRLEAFVRNARTEPHDAIRFDLPDRPGRLPRSLSACIVPLVPLPDSKEPPLRVVLLFDAARRRVAAEMLRLAEQGIPRRELAPLIEAAREVFRASALVGDSPALSTLRGRLEALARSDAPLLIQGPSGSGKELVARIVHFSGGRSGPFVPVNCAALPGTMLQSELFGHQKGAFPEAITDRPGLFQQAQHGTLFLQEIGQLPPALQQELQEALEHGRVRRMGASNPERIDVRLIASSRMDLARAVEQGGFRGELLGLFAARVTLPRLRERAGDVPLLARHFLARFAPGRALSPEALWLLEQYDWPGNVRELLDSLESACATAGGREVQVSDLPAPLQGLYQRLARSEGIPAALPRVAAHAPAELEPELVVGPGTLLDAYEKRALLHALRETGGDKLKAAKLVGVGKSTFYRKLKLHGIT